MSQSTVALLKAMQMHSLAVKKHLQLGTAADSNTLQGQTLAQVLAAAAAAANAYTDLEVADLVEGNALVEAVDAAIAELGAPIGGDFNTAIIEKVLPLAGTQIDPTTANHFTKTITGATAFTVINVPQTANRVVSFVLHLTNGGLGEITWPANTRWAEGTKPTLTTSGKDKIALSTMDGGLTWDGYVLGKDMKVPV